MWLMAGPDSKQTQRRLSVSAGLTTAKAVGWSQWATEKENHLRWNDSESSNVKQQILKAEQDEAELKAEPLAQVVAKQ